MRRSLVLAGGALVAATAAFAQPVTLSLFGGGDFQPGSYSVSGGANRCIMSPESLMHVGLEAADGKSCVHTIVEDTTERATVAYSCRGLGSGRTTIVKDNRNHFTIDAQGIRGREPFAVRQEFKRVGDC